MPDWRNPEDYEYTKVLRLREWAWEFLRRSEGYRRAYNEHLVALQQIRSEPVDGKIEVSYRGLFACERFGLWKMHSPDTRADQIKRFNWTFVSPAISRRWEPESEPVGTWPGYPDAVALVFDLTMPLDVQLKVAAYLLGRLHKIRSSCGHPPPTRARIQRKAWTRYLRLLDAKLAGESIGEMGRVLFKGYNERKGAQRAVRRATEMADHGYRQLAALEFTNREGL